MVWEEKKPKHEISDGQKKLWIKNIYAEWSQAEFYLTKIGHLGPLKVIIDLFNFALEVGRLTDIYGWFS